MLRAAWSRGGVFALVLAGCGGAAPAQPNARVARVPAVVAAKNARERLTELLRALPRPEPVLAVLPADARTRLDARYTALDAERRQAVHSDESPLVESLPLLHLASGGSSPRALFALATTPAGSEELSGLIAVDGDPGARVRIVSELARRAAQIFLRDRAADLGVAGKETALVCRLVARAALVQDRHDIVLAARELLAEFEPSAENRLEFAHDLARAGDAKRAAEVLARARDDRARPPHANAVVEVDSAIDAATFVDAHHSPSDAGGRLSLARAWLHLGRFAEARTLLEPATAEARSSLGLAAAYAETQIEIPSCPELPPDVGTAPLCAESFRSSPRVQAALALLADAWKSGGGRDDEAVETYVALAVVIPWMHDTAHALGSGALTAAESNARIADLQLKIRDVVIAAPRLAGLSLFVETLQSGAALRDPSARSEADTSALIARALELAKTDQSRFAQAGILAVAAAFSRAREISALVDAVPADKTEPSLRVPRTALDVWAAAAVHGKPRMDSARGELAAIMSEGLGDSLGRARLVLTVSEADALLAGDERSYQLLSRVAGQLLQDNVPPDLAFRAVLDAAGALDHGHRGDRAKDLLHGAASAEFPQDQSRARDLLALVRGYELVLGTAGGAATALANARTQLPTLASAQPSVSSALWFELWSHELEAREREFACQKRKQTPCREALALRRVLRSSLQTKLGAQAAAVLEHGALPAGGFDAGFRFSAETGLEPFIVFDPNLIAIGLPKLAIE